MASLIGEESVNPFLQLVLREEILSFAEETKRNSGQQVLFASEGQRPIWLFAPDLPRAVPLTQEHIEALAVSLGAAAIKVGAPFEDQT